jgi:hypothetical protein
MHISEKSLYSVVLGASTTEHGQKLFMSLIGYQAMLKISAQKYDPVTGVDINKKTMKKVE